MLAFTFLYLKCKQSEKSEMLTLLYGIGHGYTSSGEDPCNAYTQVLKRWTKDARDILPQHLVQYQKDNSVNLSFTCRNSMLYLKAMEVVRMGDAGAESFDHMFVGL